MSESRASSSQPAGGEEAGEFHQEMVEKPFVKDVATGEKLSTLLDGFEPFDEAMRMETRLRREKDAKKVAAMKAEMQRLEGTLREQGAVHARMNEDLQAHCDAELAKAKDAFGSLLDHQNKRVHERLDVLEKRADALEAHFQTEKTRILREIEERSAQLSKLLDEFQTAFEKERKQRLLREGTISSQMEQHEKHTDAAFKEERAARDAKVAEITKELVSCVASRAAADVQLEKVCTSEIAKIQAALDVEVTQRELQDDNIITALNQYTNKLQSSLNIINSTNA
jgi:hypothetical protein